MVSDIPSLSFDRVDSFNEFVILVMFTLILSCFALLVATTCGQDIYGCGGFIKSSVDIDFALIEVSPPVNLCLHVHALS